MKYFRDDYCNEIDLHNAIKKYEKAFNKVKDKLPPKLIDLYYTDFHGLHDSIIEKIEMNKDDTTLDISIKFISCTDIPFQLIYKDVKDVKLQWNMPSSYSPIGDYLIGEFLACEKKLISHEFKIYNNVNNIYLKFKKLEFILL